MLDALVLLVQPRFQPGDHSLVGLTSVAFCLLCICVQPGQLVQTAAKTYHQPSHRVVARGLIRNPGEVLSHCADGHSRFIRNLLLCASSRFLHLS